MKPILITAIMLAQFITTSVFAIFEAHEWGTFTSLVGSNGFTQHGMYHEDEKLPDFVHGFGETQSSIPLQPKKCDFPNMKFCFDFSTIENSLITQKMETPVIYFYSHVDRKVEVKVDFPEGLITETYPAPISSSPQNTDSLDFKNGKAHFAVNILARSPFVQLPFVEKENIYGHARQTKSQTIQTNNEFEKFIFYRGLGRFQPEFSMTSQKGDFFIQSKVEDLPTEAYLVFVDDRGDGRMIKVLGQGSNTIVETLDPKFPDGEIYKHLRVSKTEIADLKSSVFHRLKGHSAHDALVESLEINGLFNDEAEAMVNTWENGYLKTPGLRLLYVLPRPEVDKVLPLSILPVPEKVERVFVGRIEIMLDTDEHTLVASIINQQESFDINSLGRFAEPKIRRAKEVYSELCKDQASSFSPCLTKNLLRIDSLIAESIRNTAFSSVQ